METKTYITRGTCARSITYDIDDEQRVHNVRFEGGCPGNAIGIARLVEGMKADEVTKLLKGVRCGYKATSCPDQLALALEQETK